MSNTYKCLLPSPEQLIVLCSQSFSTKFPTDKSKKENTTSNKSTVSNIAFLSARSDRNFLQWIIISGIYRQNFCTKYNNSSWNFFLTNPFKAKGCFEKYLHKETFFFSCCFNICKLSLHSFF